MNLEQLRQEINKTDSQLLDLFCQRMDLVKRVAQYKIDHNLPVYHPGREQEIIRSIRQKAKECYRDQAAAIFQTIMDISKDAQQSYLASQGCTSPLKQKVLQALQAGEYHFHREETAAVAGVKGAYAYNAANQMLENPTITCYPSFEDVFHAVESGKTSFGVVPIENSSAGSVGEVYDLLNKHQLTICKTYKYPVSHCLLAKQAVPISAITDVYSHEQGIAQCYTFLHTNPQIMPHTYANTAMAAEFVANSSDPDVAAIASADCAQLYGLTVLQQDLQDAKNNYTRFVCISKDLKITPDADKISLVLSLPHVPGALHRIITRIALCGLNLTKIESRPILNTDFEFLFYFDFEGSVKDQRIMALLCSFEEELDYFKFLGNYA